MKLDYMIEMDRRKNPTKKKREKRKKGINGLQNAKIKPHDSHTQKKEP